jgi:hypothetical protein
MLSEKSVLRTVFALAGIVALWMVVHGAFMPAPFNMEALFAACLPLLPIGVGLWFRTPPGKRAWDFFVRWLPDGVRGYFREEP